MEDGHLSLRPFALSDVDDYMVWASDEKVAHFCRWEPYTSKEDVLSYMKESVLPHPWFRAICLGDRPIGAISASPGSGNDSCRAELGYVLASEYWGRGIATQAAKMAVDAVFADWPHLERLEALVVVENPASQRVLEKAGFLKEGVLRKYYILKGRTRDSVMYSFLPTDRKTDAN
ncbi:hypothetical protein ACLOJK_005727 [Asimina triloba]